MDKTLAYDTTSDKRAAIAKTTERLESLRADIAALEAPVTQMPSGCRTTFLHTGPGGGPRTVLRTFGPPLSIALALAFIWHPAAFLLVVPAFIVNMFVWDEYIERSHYEATLPDAALKELARSRLSQEAKAYFASHLQADGHLQWERVFNHHRSALQEEAQLRDRLLQRKRSANPPFAVGGDCVIRRRCVRPWRAPG